MVSTSSSPGSMLLATAMAVSGTVVLLALGIQKSTDDFLVNSVRQPSLPRSCLSSGSKKEKKKKRVHFAIDVVVPTGNNEEYRKKTQRNSSKAMEDSSGSNKMALHRESIIV
ncbi:hypothetical protein LIER_28018 [Lithospermum erythrorhizon]|uniref:Uncharacterized protein n=1 Tax=Lithospermum erythrorhizon TaxID=34254 RepID=A0AAV3RE64_LITER